MVLSEENYPDYSFRIFLSLHATSERGQRIRVKSDVLGIARSGDFRDGNFFFFSFHRFSWVVFERKNKVFIPVSREIRSRAFSRLFWIAQKLLERENDGARDRNAITASIIRRVITMSNYYSRVTRGTDVFITFFFSFFFFFAVTVISNYRCPATIRSFRRNRVTRVKCSTKASPEKSSRAARSPRVSVELGS